MIQLLVSFAVFLHVGHIPALLIQFGANFIRSSCSIYKPVFIIVITNMDPVIRLLFKMV